MIRRPTLATASSAALVTATVSADLTADPATRELSGIVVPFGKPGRTSAGALTFTAGSLTWSDPSRVKLLREHNQGGIVYGYALELIERPEGLWGRFAVADGPAGDEALAEAAAKLRDAFSVGVELDETTKQRLARARGAAVAGAGQLREVSLVAVPAFDDARMGAAADLTTATTNTTSTAPREDTPTMNEQQKRRLAALRAQETMTQAEAAELSQLAALEGAAPAAGEPAPAAAPAGDAAPAATATASTALATAGAVAGPVAVPAVAGAAVVTATPSTYGFSGDSEHSVVTDLMAASLRGDGAAAERVEKFNAELRDGNPASLHAFVTAAATRDDIDGAGTDLPSMFQPNQNRPDLMRALVDVKRPMVSRLTRTPITNAQPFSIPKVGEYEGVGDHTEGTAHRAAGSLSLGGDTVQPRATSGAWEASRELLDAANPALDAIAARAMLRDYQRQTEGKVAALFAARAAQQDSTRYNVAELIKLRRAMLDFVNDDDEAGNFVALSKGMLGLFAEEVDATDRPQLPFIGASNAVGTLKPGAAGFTVDSVEPFRAARLDGALGTTGGVGGVMARTEGIIWAESNVLQFRFDEVKGPGVIKLALWAYSGAAILDTADVQIIRAGAAPVGG